MTASTPASSASDGTYLRTEFLERIAHDLRGPAGVTAGAIDEIERALGPDAENLKPLLLMARRGMRRVLRLAERLQRTAQLEAGSVRWAKSPSDLRALAEKAAHDAEYLEGRRTIRLQITSDETPCVVAVDSAWVLAAMTEAIGNAIRFARANVTVETRKHELDVRLIITDDGPGFSGPAPLRFEPPPSKRGIALSVPLMHDVLAAHGGRVEITSAPSESATGTSGATVILAFPRGEKGADKEKR